MPMKNWISLLFVGIIFFLSLKFQNATNIPLAVTKFMVLLGVGMMGLFIVKRN